MRTGGKGETAMNDKTVFETNSMNKLVQFSFDHMADGVCITDWRGWVMFSNPAAREILEIGEKKNGRIWEMIPFVAANDELIQTNSPGDAEGFSSRIRKARCCSCWFI